MNNMLMNKFNKASVKVVFGKLYNIVERNKRSKYIEINPTLLDGKT
jgi:hypothetical protein